MKSNFFKFAQNFGFTKKAVLGDHIGSCSKCRSYSDSLQDGLCTFCRSEKEKEENKEKTGLPGFDKNKKQAVTTRDLYSAIVREIKKDPNRGVRKMEYDVVQMLMDDYGRNQEEAEKIYDDWNHS